MEVFSKSDIGLVRSQNQDDCRFGVVSPSTAWAVVCDGMGGAAGGNVASATAVELISEQIEQLYDETLTKDQLATLLTDIVRRANSHLFDISITASLFL